MKLIYKEITIALTISIFIILFSFMLSRHLGYISLMVPYIFYVIGLNRNWLILEIENKRIKTIEYILFNCFYAFLGFLPFAGLMRIASNYEVWIIGIIGVLILLIVVPATYYFIQIKKSKENFKNLEFSYDQVNAEIKLLQSQINPHFLFNTLNTIYGVSMRENSVLTGELILKLSDIMRYMILVRDIEKIELNKEIDFIKAYIDLQNHRIKLSKGVQVNIDIQNKESNLYISPLLLIPFLENAFKYGVSFKSDSWIDIKLTIDNNTLDFSISNSKHKKFAIDQSTGLGTGLNNVKRRLNMIYFNKYNLYVHDNTNEFTVSLRIYLE